MVIHNCDLTFNNNVYDKRASNLTEVQSTFWLNQAIKDPRRVTPNTSSLIDHIAESQPISSCGSSS